MSSYFIDMRSGTVHLLADGAGRIWALDNPNIMYPITEEQADEIRQLCLYRKEAFHAVLKAEVLEKYTREQS